MPLRWIYHIDQRAWIADTAKAVLRIEKLQRTEFPYALFVNGEEKRTSDSRQHLEQVAEIYVD